MPNPVAIFLTKFHCCDSHGKADDTAWGYRLYDDFDSVFYDSYESLGEAVEALSVKNILHTIRMHHPHFLDGIEREGGLIIDGSWVNREDLAAAHENEDG